VRILITGATGLLGIALQESIQDNVELFGVYHPPRSLPLPLRAQIRPADVTDMTLMRAIFEWAKPYVVIHAAAIGSVDFAEQHREQTRAVNVGGTQVVAALCREFNSKLVYISSNAVFDGNTPFYSETDPVNPINYYGKLKVEAEETVKVSGASWAIIRPILMYGWNYPGERQTPVAWWLQSLRERKPIKVVNNVFSKPLYVESCAQTVWAAVRLQRCGLFHIAGRDHISLYHFALKTAETFGLDSKLIEPVPDSYFPELAARPRDTSFDTTKMESELGVAPMSVEEGLQRMKGCE